LIKLRTISEIAMISTCDWASLIGKKYIYNDLTDAVVEWLSEAFLNFGVPAYYPP